MLKECVQQLLYDNGLSAGEKFFIVNLKGAKLNGIFYINTNAVKTRDILKCSDDDRDYTYILASLLNGEYLIKAISYYPEQGNEFYFIDIKSEVEFGIITDKPLIAYIDAHPKFVQDIGAVANEMKNIERKQQGRIYRPRILKELFSE